MNSIRTVKKLPPPDYRTFDQQFWPVLIALTVLSGIAVGAMLAVLRGPWLWGSLLFLPTLVAALLFLLYRLDDTQFRRSFQLAILSSLALHLSFLIFASLISIFRTLDLPTPQPVAQKPPRTIEISDRRASFVWEEPNRQETPEPIVEQRREKTPTTDLKPQPTIVEETQPDSQAQLVRRETPVESVPRMDQSLSQLRRQRENFQPRSRLNRPVEITQPAPSSLAVSASSPSSVASEAELAAENRREPTESQPSPAPSENSSASLVARQRDTREPSLERAKPVPAETRPNIKLADAMPPQVPVERIEQPAQASPARASTLRTAPTPQLTQALPKSESLETERTFMEREIAPQPAPLAGEVSRRPTASAVLAPAVAPLAEREQQLQSEVTQSAQRRETELPLPTIALDTSTQTAPRRAVTDADVALSTAELERPSVPTQSQSNETAVNPRALSMTRSTSGIAGVGRAENLQAASGGATSPATRPSDSAARTEAMSESADVRQLVNSPTAPLRRSTQAAYSPSSALKAEVNTPTNVAGSQIAADRTLEAAAARVESSRSDRRDQVSVERGSASVDLGPTKVVPDQTQSPRRSGGGQTEVSQLNPDPTERSRALGQHQPRLAAAASAQVTAAPASPSSVPTASQLDPTAEATSVARSSGNQATAVKRDSAAIAGVRLDAGHASQAMELTASQSRATRAPQSISPANPLESVDSPKSGNTRTEVSAAPQLKGDSGLGTANRPTGLSRNQSIRDVDPPDVPGEAALPMQRSASSAAEPNQESGIGRSALSKSIDSIARLSAVDSTAPRRSPKPGATDLGTVVQDLSAEGKSRREALAVANPLQPQLRGDRASSQVPLERTQRESQSQSARDRSDSTQPETLTAADVGVDRGERMQADQGFELEIVALEGAPGLSKQPSDSLGTPIRPSDKESLKLQPNLDSRLRNPKFGSKPAINPDAVVTTEAFRNRTASVLTIASEPSTEAAIQLGLQFLTRHQNPDGSWSLGNFDRDHPQQAVQLNSDAAATGLALLAYQGAGYNHREFKYAAVVRRGIFWLIENQREDGCLYVTADAKSNASCRMYSHGIAALALTEAYGMTQDPRLKEPAQRAIDYIVATQEASKGGWRYFDGPNERSADTSVSGWMMMALHSGRLVGLSVEAKVFRGVDKWLEYSVDPDDSAKYRYNPFLGDAQGISRIQGRQPTASMTSVGLLMRIYGGLDRNDPALRRGASWLVRDHLPSDATPERRDTYYWYYATQVLKYIDGPMWKAWDDRLRPLLIQSQIKSGEMAGSWHPYEPIPDRWGAFGGRLYVTTMNLLSLEVRHRMLPLYQKTNPTDSSPITPR